MKTFDLLVMLRVESDRGEQATKATLEEQLCGMQLSHDRGDGHGPMAWRIAGVDAGTSQPLLVDAGVVPWGAARGPWARERVSVLRSAQR